MAKQLDYVNTTFEINGVKYKATELPFDRDFSDLEFNLPARCSPIFAAMAVAQKTNSRMGKEVSQSPTYPIKENDLVWVALINYKKDSRDTPIILNQVFPQPFVIQTDPQDKIKATALIERGKSHSHISSGTLSNYINPLKVTNYVNVRLYRHVDRASQPETEVTEPVFEFETEMFTRGPVDTDLSLDEMIEQDLQDETLDNITKRIKKEDIK